MWDWWLACDHQRHDEDERGTVAKDGSVHAYKVPEWKKVVVEECGPYHPLGSSSSCCGGGGSGSSS